MISLFLDAVNILEEDFIPKPIYDVPFYLTRYDLYADWTHNRQQYDQNILLLDAIWEGLSVFDLSIKYNLKYEDVKSFFNGLLNLGLINKELVNSNYTRNTNF